MRATLPANNMVAGGGLVEEVELIAVGGFGSFWLGLGFCRTRMGSLSEESSLDEDRRRGRRIQGMQDRDMYLREN